MMTDRLEAALAELVAAIREEVATTATSTSGPDRLLSVAAAAEAMGVKRTTLYQEIQAGRLRSLRVGRRRLIPASAITERIEAAPAVQTGAAAEDASGRRHSAA